MILLATSWRAQPPPVGGLNEGAWTLVLVLCVVALGVAARRHQPLAIPASLAAVLSLLGPCLIWACEGPRAIDPVGGVLAALAAGGVVALAALGRARWPATRLWVRVLTHVVGAWVAARAWAGVADTWRAATLDREVCVERVCGPVPELPTCAPPTPTTSFRQVFSRTVDASDGEFHARLAPHDRVLVVGSGRRVWTYSGPDLGTTTVLQDEVDTLARFDGFDRSGRRVLIALADQLVLAPVDGGPWIRLDLPRDADGRLRRRRWTDVVVSADGARVVGVPDAGAVLAWDVARPDAPLVFEEAVGDDWVSFVRATDDASTVVGRCEPNDVCLWDARSPGRSEVRVPIGRYAWDHALSHGTGLLVFGGYGASVVSLDGEATELSPWPHWPLRSVARSPDRDALFVLFSSDDPDDLCGAPDLWRIPLDAPDRKVSLLPSDCRVRTGTLVEAPGGAQTLSLLPTPKSPRWWSRLDDQGRVVATAALPDGVPWPELSVGPDGAGRLLVQEEVMGAHPNASREAMRLTVFETAPSW